MPFNICWSLPHVLKEHVELDRLASFLVTTDVWSFRERSLSRRTVAAANDSPAKGTEVFRKSFLLRVP